MYAVTSRYQFPHIVVSPEPMCCRMAHPLPRLKVIRSDNAALRQTTQCGSWTRSLEVADAGLDALFDGNWAIPFC